jgi:hypothetical protein
MQVTWNTDSLMSEYWPTHRDANKACLFDLALPADTVFPCELTVSRWRAFDLPDLTARLAAPCRFEAVPGFYDYVNVAPEAGMDWFLNFASLDAFSTWRTGLMAQDEIQVAEHPALAAIHLKARALDISLRTSDETGAIAMPTPVLVAGVERRLSIETVASGLYGNAFASASLDAIRRAVRVLAPPSISHILAMEAPQPRRGCYTARDIESILITAYSGFCAVVQETKRFCGADAASVIHSGFWGCGAYGGNRTLMVFLQMLAARLAGVSEVRFHIGERADMHHFEDALALDVRLSQPHQAAIRDLLSELEQLAFQWGASDGN